MSGDLPSAEEIETALIDFGFFHSFSEVARMYSERENKNLLGYAGGVMDQPEEYWDDMTTMGWLKLWVQHVGPMPRMEQTSVFDNLRNGGQLNGKWLGGGDAR